MRKSLVCAALASATVTFASAPIAVAAHEGQAAHTHYSVETTLVGKLLDDPDAAAILQKLIPSVYANEMFKTMGRDLTLKAIQEFEPDQLSNENLAKIQAEFDKIPAKA